jgi:uncharacterized protein (TIGR00299 family) protein
MSFQATHLWVDASAGIAGDMLLGALLDAGADLGVVAAAVESVLKGAVELRVSTVTRAGLRATKIDVDLHATDPPHRTWRTIADLLARAALDDNVRQRAMTVFARLADAEATVHGIPAADVHFHEVGALDSIADVVGVCAALTDLGVHSLSAGAVAVGSGRVRVAHGEIPVPVPAVAQLALGWTVHAGGDGELTTPTGMALIAALCGRCEELPALTVRAVGVGAGTRDVKGRPNVTRVVLGSVAEPNPVAAPSAPLAGGVEVVPSAGTDPDPAPGAAAMVLEANVDDLDPRLWPGVLDRLLLAGAADAWLVPILMKKGRPAHTLCVLCAPAQAPILRAVIFDWTSTIGVRQQPAAKFALPRGWVDVAVDAGSVPIKIAHSGGVIVQATPEFDDVAALATISGRPPREVLAAAAAAAGAAGLTPGAPLPADLRVSR